MEYHIADDFIGVFRGFFPDELCDRYVSYFQQLDQQGLIYRRPRSSHEIDDACFDQITTLQYLENYSIPYTATEFTEIFWRDIYSLYSQRFSTLKDMERHQIYDIKIQRTKPGGGYHLWHSEATSRAHSNRILVFSLFLNTVTEGGETEFLYQKRRVPAEKNCLILWPSGFTHTHRGNPPLSNDKYIITGWVEF
jgi:hypothetical protein